MARATAPRSKTRYYGEGSRPVLVPAKPKAGALIYGLTMAALTAQGQLVSASDPAALYAVGRVDDTVDNRQNKQPDCEYRRGVFNWGNDGTITQANVGQRAAIADDQTVKAFADGDKLAGLILFIDDKGVWVESSPELAIMLNA